MKVYVASAWSDFRVARAAQNMLRALGHTISHDWTEHADEYATCDAASEEVRLESAIADVHGVLVADGFLLCAPAEGGSGCWTELGIALAGGADLPGYKPEDPIAEVTAGRRVVVCGPGRDRNVFARLAHRVETVEQAVAWLDQESRR